MRAKMENLANISIKSHRMSRKIELDSHARGKKCCDEITILKELFFLVG